jgi:hypothetical protein
MGRWQWQRVRAICGVWQRTYVRAIRSESLVSRHGCLRLAGKLNEHRTAGALLHQEQPRHHSLHDLQSRARPSRPARSSDSGTISNPGSAGIPGSATPTASPGCDNTIIWGGDTNGTSPSAVLAFVPCRMDQCLSSAGLAPTGRWRQPRSTDDS